MIWRIVFMALMLFCAGNLAWRYSGTNPDAAMLCVTSFIAGTMFALRPMNDMLGECLRIAEYYRDSNNPGGPR